MLPRDDAPDGSAYLIWTLQDKQSRYFSKAADVAAAAASLADGGDVYIGAALRKAGLAPHERGSADQCVGLLGLFADIDIAGPGHAGGKKYPPSEREAAAVVDGVGVEPSLLIHSGGGLQAWWLFREPWIFSDDKERAVAGTLCRSWVNTLGAVAKASGWVIDPVGDLPRVLRVVGTFNYKQQPRRAVVVRRESAVRYNPGDFDDYLVAPEYCGERPQGIVEVAAVTLAGGRGLPLRASELLANDSQFKRLWNFNRTDFDSPSDVSRYDMAFASIGALHGWSDQEIADTIGAWRESQAVVIAARSGKTPDEVIAKGRRRNYITRTIGRARADKQAERAIQEIAASPEVRDKSLVTDEKRAEFLRSLSAIFKRRVVRWVRHGKENAIFTLELGDPHVCIRIGDAAEVMNYQRFAARLFAYDVLIEVNRKQWPDVLRSLMTVVEEETTTQDTPAERFMAWLRDYVGRVKAFGPSEWHKCYPRDVPFIKDGRLWIHSGNMRRWLLDAKITVRDEEWFDDLRASNLKPKTVGHSSWGTSRTYWSIPLDDLPPDWPDMKRARSAKDRREGGEDALGPASESGDGVTPPPAGPPARTDPSGSDEPPI